MRIKTAMKMIENFMDIQSLDDIELPISLNINGVEHVGSVDVYDFANMYLREIATTMTRILPWADTSKKTSESQINHIIKRSFCLAFSRVSEKWDDDTVMRMIRMRKQCADESSDDSSTEEVTK